MTRIFVFLYALFACALDLRAGSSTIYSQNRRFSVSFEFKDSRAEGVRATMHGIENGRKRVLWKKEFDDLVTDYKTGVIVANDGKFFAVIGVDQIVLFTPETEKEIDDDVFTSKDLQGNEFLAGFGIVNGREIVRLWDVGKDAWRVVTLPDFEEVAVTPELQRQWNDITRQELLTKFEARELQRMRNRIKEAAPFVARAIEEIAPEQPEEGPGTIGDVFVAMRHDPRDRPRFERMLNQMPDRHRNLSGLGTDSEGVFCVTSHDDIREQGDLLLAIYDGRLKPDANGEFAREDIEKKYYLSSVRGKIQLPVPMPTITKPGVIRVFLVPESAKNGRWWKSAELEELELPLQPRTTWLWAASVKRVAYYFNTVTPGKYFLKVIWDKRPPLTDRREAGPGDYESNWLGPIQLAAGSSVTNPIVQCAQRAKGGDEYYAADEQALRKWNEAESLQTTELPKAK